MSGPADELDLPEPRRGEAGSALPEPGAERIDEFDVTGPLLTDVGGTSCTARAQLTQVVDGRKLYFDVEVREGERTIGVGTHQRRVIAVAAPES